MATKSCTKPAIAEDVQETTSLYVQVAEVRANLRGILAAGKPVSIRRRVHDVGVLIPLPEWSWWSDGSREKALRAARRAAIAHFDVLLNE